MDALFSGIQENKRVDWEFHAAMNGIDLKAEQGKKENVSSSSSTASKPIIPLFQDPEAYQSISLEEREAMTKEMQGSHKRWAGKSFLKGQ